MKKKCEEPPQHLILAKQVYTDYVIENSRISAWNNAIQLSKQRHVILAKMVIYMFDLLNTIQKEKDDVFSYIPEYFLDSVIELFCEIRKQTEFVGPIDA